MFGYCAIGSWAIATSPSRTIRIDSEIAKIGRSTKNRDTLSRPRGAAYFEGLLAGEPVGAAAGFADTAGDSATVGFTLSPVFTFSSPSTMTRSPGFRPVA